MVGDEPVGGAWALGNSYVPMPLASGGRLTLTNDGPDLVASVGYHVECDRPASLTNDVGRFHASWNRQNPTPRRRESYQQDDAREIQSIFTSLQPCALQNFSAFVTSLSHASGG